MPRGKTVDHTGKTYGTLYVVRRVEDFLGASSPWITECKPMFEPEVDKTKVFDSGAFKPYTLEDLHGKTGTIYVGVGDAVYGEDGCVKTVMFVDKESGKAYVLATDHS